MRYIRFTGNRAENLFGQGTKISHLLEPNVVTEADDDDAEGWVRSRLAVYAETEADLAELGLNEEIVAAKSFDSMTRAELLAALEASGHEISEVTGTGAKAHVTNDDLRAFLLALDSDDSSQDE